MLVRKKDSLREVKTDRFLDHATEDVLHCALAENLVAANPVEVLRVP